MEFLTVNYLAIFVGSVLSMAVGAVWYGPLFGKKWMELEGVDLQNKQAIKEMQKSAGPLYVVQFLMTLFQVLVLAHLVADTTRVGGLERSLWIWGAFVIPTVAGSCMWTAASGKKKWKRFWIQGGYQLVIFVIFGLLLQYWK